MAQTLTSTFLEVVQVGAARRARSVEIIEPGSATAVEPGDLVLGIGVHTPEQAVAVAQRSRTAAGLVLRHDVAPAARLACRDAGLTLLALAEQSSWSAVAQVMRSALEPSNLTDDADSGYQDLFTLADTLSALLEAPVTIEDPGSRVLAWSSEQPDVDGARTATIIGRRVPPEVRDRYRARGVFRQLASSDEPFLVPGEDGIRPRWILPVRAGGEWLGSVWAALPTDEVPPRAAQAGLLADVLALHLLRLRARTDLHRQIEVEQVRSVLRGTSERTPDWWENGPWHVAVLSGPADASGAPLAPPVRQQVWATLLRRHGWARPLVADLDGDVLALLPQGRNRAGRVDWLREVLLRERQPSLWVTVAAVRSGAAAHGTVASRPWDGHAPAAGPPRAGSDVPAAEAEDASRSPGVAGMPLAAGVAGLSAGSTGTQTVTNVPMAVTAAREQAALGQSVAGPFSTGQDVWAALHTARALNAGTVDLPSPVRDLMALSAGADLVRTLTEVLQHGGDPQAAARALGVHPNTVRNRLHRITSMVALDLDDPTQRLAAWLECLRLRR